MRKREKWNPFGDTFEELKKLSDDRVKKRERYQKKQPADSQANKNFHRKMNGL